MTKLYYNGLFNSFYKNETQSELGLSFIYNILDFSLERNEHSVDSFSSLTGWKNLFQY